MAAIVEQPSVIFICSNPEDIITEYLDTRPLRANANVRFDYPKMGQIAGPNEFIICMKPLIANMASMEHVFVFDCDAVFEHADELLEKTGVHFYGHHTMQIFTDGSCSGNGSATARAGYSAVSLTYQPGSQFTTREPTYEYSGPVAPHAYKWVDAENMRAGFVPDETSAAIVGTNNRGELLGLINAFLLIMQEDIPETTIIEIVSDCGIYSRLLMETFAKKSKKEISELKNPDLVLPAVRLFRDLQSRYDIVITHCRGHKKAPAKVGRAWNIWNGNDVADFYAKKHVYG